MPKMPKLYKTISKILNSIIVSKLLGILDI